MVTRRDADWVERLLTLLVIAAVLAVLDQYVKFEIPTPSFAQHHRSELWFFGSCARDVNKRFPKVGDQVTVLEVIMRKHLKQ